MLMHPVEGSLEMSSGLLGAGRGCGVSLGIYSSAQKGCWEGCRGEVLLDK